MENVTIRQGNLTVTVERLHVSVMFYDGVEHRLKISRQSMGYVRECEYLRQYHDTIYRAVAVWEEFFGKGVQQIAI